jgi:hypothetical protein
MSDPDAMNQPMTLAETIPDIDLRWTLRDIRANRTVLMPPRQAHLDELLRRGCVEMRTANPSSLRPASMPWTCTEAMNRPTRLTLLGIGICLVAAICLIVAGGHW